MRALVVEDDPAIHASVAAALEGSGFRVDWAADGETAWFLGGTEDFNLIVLDLGLPGMDGLSVLKRWRAEGCHVPVVILTARGMWSERVEGIDAGADDYLIKPFRMEELLARCRAVLRRSMGSASPVLALGRLSVDLGRRTAAVDGVPVTLTPMEFRLLAHLMTNRDRPVSASELREHLNGGEDWSDGNAVVAMIMRMRRKLGSEVILTRRGFGYQLGPCG
ncbi:MAG TPA: response regulator transcription factor [Paracoccus sp. (in: a-proteobacteria)]|nr:response regulator transcription factor [Paracoccus sp. (in: a-proteobacteria)]